MRQTDMRRRQMTDLASAGIAGVAGKLAGLSVGAVVATVVVMVMTRPQSVAEWTVALLSTVMSSMAGGAYAVAKLGLIPVDGDFLGLMVLIGLAFVCGLPAWILVRAGFAWADRRKSMDLAQLLREAKRGWRDE